MADKTVEQPEVAVDVTEKEKKVVENETTPSVEEDGKSENGDSKENGDAKKKENGKETTNGDSKAVEVEADKCCIKRKSTGAGDAPEEKPSEGATPEKKAKLDEPAEAESNGEAEVAA